MIERQQLIDGLAQALGEAPMSRLVYDGGGQLVTGSFTDYALSRAIDIPSVEPESPPAHRPSMRLRLKA